MAEEKVYIDFDPNDYIIRLSPFLDKKGEWTGELMVGTVTTDDNNMSDYDHFQLMHLTEMVCASIPAMEEDDDFRQVLADIVSNIQEELKDVEVTAEKKVVTVDDNVINVKFH